MAKIVFLGPAHPYRGGIAQFNQMLAKTFISRGEEVKMSNFSVQYPSFLFPGKSQYSDSPAPDGLSIKREVNSINPFNWIKIGLKLFRERPDMIIVRYWLPLLSPCLGTICRLARMNKHTKVIALTDNVIPHEHRPFDKLFTKYFVGAVDAFVYMSAQVKIDLDKFTTKKPSAFSPHPLYDVYGSVIDRTVACKYLKLDPNYRYSLFFGFIREYKGLDLLIEAWGEMKRDGTLDKRRVIVAGEFYTDKEKYLSLIALNGLENDIIIHDIFVNDSDVKYYFSVADLVIQPYKSATQSGVTQIAYSFNVPMIVTNVGGLSEIVPDRVVGYVVDTKPSAIATAVERAYEEGRMAAFRANMESEKNRFSWNAMADCFYKLYDGLTN